MERRRRPNRTSGALMASLLLHGAAVTALALSSGAPPRQPKTKVYAVDIVSPPPNMAGEPLAAAPSTQEPGPAAPAPAEPAAPDPAPPAQPDPPAAAPDPEPAPPKEEAPKEPAKAPEPRRTPPAQTPPRPNATNPRPNASNRPNTNTPATRPPPTPTPATNRPATNRPAGGSTTPGGTGSGTNRTRGDGTSTGPATGRNPDANSPGGEGLTIYSPGDPCPVAGFCENVSRQIARYFRPPSGTNATGVVCFRLHRDGSVTDIEVERLRRGSASIRLSMMEAAEAAGSRRAFGTLPATFPSGGRWCIELAPS